MDFNVSDIRSRKANKAQTALLNSVMRNNPLSTGYSNDLKLDADKQWSDLTEQLNTLGRPKTKYQWRQAWRDMLYYENKKKRLEEQANNSSILPDQTPSDEQDFTMMVPAPIIVDLEEVTHSAESSQDGWPEISQIWQIISQETPEISQEGPGISQNETDFQGTLNWNTKISGSKTDPLLGHLHSPSQNGSSMTSPLSSASLASLRSQKKRRRILKTMDRLLLTKNKKIELELKKIQIEDEIIKVEKERNKIFEKNGRSEVAALKRLSDVLEQIADKMD